ncbi:helix-turn-helix transcriptional regulator (plasmid) [Fructilactobacillus vespulae]|uniref:helix-turn-helix transcriptional regulator n=1 Tax=Fructilactobacillus vespulae TaxID=1249630 RepID=UPI0039B47EBB
MSKIDEYIVERSQRDPEFKEAVEEGKMSSEASDKVYELRKELGLTQREFAKLVGKPQSTIARIESGDMYPSTQLLATLAFKTKKKFIINFK